jgi:hypothetical protein
MSRPADQPTRIARDLEAMALLRHGPVRSIELEIRLKTKWRTTKRILAAVREAGAWARAQGLPWYEIETEIRGAERWHRLVDHPADRQIGPPLPCDLHGS